MRRLFLIDLRVKGVYKEHAYEDILRIESLTLLLLLELLFLVLNLIQCQVALLTTGFRCGTHLIPGLVEFFFIVH